MHLGPSVSLASRALGSFKRPGDRGTLFPRGSNATPISREHRNGWLCDLIALLLSDRYKISSTLVATARRAPGSVSTKTPHHSLPQVDVHEYLTLVGCLEDISQAFVIKRVGWLAAWSASRPDGLLELALDRREERQVAKV